MARANAVASQPSAPREPLPPPAAYTPPPPPPPPRDEVLPAPPVVEMAAPVFEPATPVFVAAAPVSEPVTPTDAAPDPLTTAPLTHVAPVAPLAPVFAAPAPEHDVPDNDVPDDDFTPAPPFKAVYAATASHAPDTPFGDTLTATLDEILRDEPLAPPARTIDEERQRQHDAAARDTYAPLDEPISRTWPPPTGAYEQVATVAEAPDHPTPYATAQFPAAPAGTQNPEFTPADAAYSPLPTFLTPPPEPEIAAPAQVPATNDRFAELVYAARNKSIEFEPDALRDRSANRVPVIAVILLAVIIALALLKYRNIEALAPMTTGLFRAVGLR
jgi:hypothetical protein